MNVTVNGKAYNVAFGAAGAAPVVTTAAPAAAVSAPAGGTPVTAPVAGTLLKHSVNSGASVKKGDTVIILESMKMELEVKAPCDGTITFAVQPGTQVTVGMALASVSAAAASAPASSASVAPAAAPAGGKPVNAPVAGTLLKYAVAEGDSVTADTTIMYVESMKMELEIKAGASGKVHFIAAPGTQISNGQVIAEVK